MAELASPGPPSEAPITNIDHSNGPFISPPKWNELRFCGLFEELEPRILARGVDTKRCSNLQIRAEVDPCGRLVKTIKSVIPVGDQSAGKKTPNVFKGHSECF